VQTAKSVYSTTMSSLTTETYMEKSKKKKSTCIMRFNFVETLSSS